MADNEYDKLLAGFSTLSWGFLFAASAALVKFSLYVSDDPRPSAVQKVISVLSYAAAAFCVFHGVSLVLTGNWSF